MCLCACRDLSLSPSLSLRGWTIFCKLLEAVERPKEPKEKDQKADKHKKSGKDDKSAKVNCELLISSSMRATKDRGSSLDSFATNASGA